MTSYTREQFERLPKWARSEIERLNRDVDWWKTKASAGPEDSDTFLDNAGDGDRPLGNSPRIRFDVGPSWDQHLTARLNGEFLVIDSPRALEVQPQSSNVLRVRCGEWWK